MVIVWRVTERCNLACPFCAYDKDLPRPRRDAQVGLIFGFGRVLAEYGRETGQYPLVVWHGGEPLLWAPLAELTREFRRSFGLRVATTTNGTPLAAAAVRQHLVEDYSELTISIDAPGTPHDRLRQWPGGFTELGRSVTQLAGEISSNNSGLRLRANLVLMRDTIGEFAPLCRELARWGIQEVTFNQLGGIERPEFYPEHRLLSEQVARLAEELPALREELSALGMRLHGSGDYLERLAATANDRRIPVASCHAAERFLFIDTDGTVAPCCFTTDELGLPLSELVSAADLRELPARFDSGRRPVAPAVCGDCHSTHLFNKFCEG